MSTLEAVRTISHMDSSMWKVLIYKDRVHSNERKKACITIYATKYKEGREWDTENATKYYLL